jgi:broad specificity phosphatase PhoE
VTVVYLIRHTEPTVPDDRPRFLGQADPPLSASGMEHARRLADYLRDVPFDAVYSSDLERSMTMAALIAGPGSVPIRPDRRLREINTGLWEGLTFEEVQSRYPLEYGERERDLVGYRFPGGESFCDLLERVVPAFLEILDDSFERGGREGGGTVLVSGHRGVNRVVLCEALGLPLERLFSIKQDYGCANVIRVTRLRDGSRRFDVNALPTSGS